MQSPGCPQVLLAPQHFQECTRALDALTPAPVLARAGSAPVLVTAVHGYSHCCDGLMKPADEGTLELSLLLALCSGAHWLAVGKPDLADSNHHRDTKFKRRLAQHVRACRPRLVIDVHAAHAARPFDVDIGSLEGKTWGENKDWHDRLLQELRASGLLASDNAVFRAQGCGAGAQTVTACAFEELATPAVQLEISSALCADLATRQALHQHAKLVNALANFVQFVAGGRN